MRFDVINTQKQLTDEALNILKAADCRVRFVELVKLSSDEMCREIAGADGVVAGSEPYTARVFAAADRLKVIARTGVGVDQIDLTSATQQGVFVTNTPAATNGAVAEFTIGVILCLLRGIPAMADAMKAGRWHPVRGRELGNMTLGVVGAGGIGKRVISLARSFGTKVLAYDIHRDEQVAAKWNFEYVSLEELMQRSDIVTIHCGLDDSTRGLIGQRQLDLMKKDAYLVNTARPHIVDSDALARKLANREITGAAIDVHDPAPCHPNDVLVSLDNVLPTSWSAYNTCEAIADMSRRAAEDLVAVLSGREPRHLVNRSVMQTALVNR